jgi:putative flavoprotein involved in K+ transport
VTYVPVVVIGAGHSGLAVSHALNGHGVDHVVLERGEIANTWKTERWDSLRTGRRDCPAWRTTATTRMAS